MKKIISFPGILVLLGVSIYSYSKVPDEPVRDAVIYATVKSKNGLDMRSKPGINNKKILTIPDGARVAVLGLYEKKDKIGGMEDYWVKVEYNNIKGWVFKDFLSDTGELSINDEGILIEVKSVSMKNYVDGRSKNNHVQIYLQPTEFSFFGYLSVDGKYVYTCSVVCGEGCDDAPSCSVNQMVFDNERIVLLLIGDNSEKIKCTIPKEAFESVEVDGTCDVQ